MDPKLKQWRDDTPGCANQIHLNNAGAGLMPRGVLDAIVGHLKPARRNFGGYEAPRCGGLDVSHVAKSAGNETAQTSL